VSFLIAANVIEYADILLLNSYEEKITDSIEKIRELASKARRENQRSLQDYLEVLDLVQPVITGVSEPFDEEADNVETLRALARDYWSAERREMIVQLKQVNYEIDDVSMVNVIVSKLSRTNMGNSRIELVYHHLAP
jgi:hypothetical protein